MTLFKYIRPERIDVIKDLEIRFTQPDALNDPFELQPHFDSLIAEADVLANLSESPVDLGSMVVQAYEMLPELRAIPIGFAMQAIEEFMATDDARKATAEGVRILLKSMRYGAAAIRDAIYRAFNENVGILSLSEIADNELMWAHYANSHRGVILCFDEHHAFFNRKRSENDGFYFIRKVIYTDGPPVSLATTDVDALLITKRTKWSYEREWRMLVPLKHATRSLTLGGDTVYLFAFPADALRGVILGAYSTLETETLVRNTLNDGTALSHVSLLRAKIDFDARSVRIPSLDAS